jgi:hypothetical protein
MSRSTMKNSLDPRRILIRTVVIVLVLLVACLVCNILGRMYLPVPAG